MAAMDLEVYKDLDRAIEQLLQCKPLSEAEVKELCAKAQNVFVNESNVQPVAAPVTVSLLLPAARAAAVRPPPAQRCRVRAGCRRCCCCLQRSGMAVGRVTENKACTAGAAAALGVAAGAVLRSLPARCFDLGLTVQPHAAALCCCRLGHSTCAGC